MEGGEEVQHTAKMPPRVLVPHNLATIGGETGEAKQTDTTLEITPPRQFIAGPCFVYYYKLK